MSGDEDLDLLALQRQLDDAFETTRPRPTFEDELWLHIQSRRPIWRRFREGLFGLIEGMREAPAVPSAAAAIVLIALVGAGIFAMSGLHLGGVGTTSGTAPNVPTAAGAANAAPLFGPVPPPGLARTAQTPVPAYSGPSPALNTSASNIYYGPATLKWAGQLEVTATSLPVFRYQEPSSAAADQFASSLGAAPAVQPVPGALGTYAGDNFTLVVIGSVTQPPQEPSFTLSEATSPSIAAGGDPVAAATAYLQARNLIPTWPYQTQVQTVGGTVKVRFLRSFDLPSQAQASLIDGAGDRYGIEVDMTAAKANVQETGPLPLSLDAAEYPIISANQAVQSAMASSAAPAATVTVVRLTTAELVYTLVVAGDHSFYEPAFLFSGTFTDHGTTFVKRVLVPALDPAFLSG
jgi:hypothetical protein